MEAEKESPDVHKLVPDRKLTEIKFLGSGAYGEAHLVKNTSDQEIDGKYGFEEN